tara:strand:- start:12366 stop:13292 length:927 start_codon:yes stop_codon:yes gene_type:complete
MDPTPNILLDTDMLTDCDDAAALASLHALADRGEARILGVAVNGIDTHGLHGAVVSAINYYYGRPNIPVAMTPRSPGQTPSKPSSYSPAIFAEYPHDGLRDAERPDAIDLYRRLLEESEDRSVTIASIGFLSNLADLLCDEAGQELVARKVRAITIMGGNYPEGNEYNFECEGSGPTTRAALASWPSTIPITYIGFELGTKINTGRCYLAAPDSPMRRSYELAYDSINRSRPSWDQIAVLHAVRGLVHGGRQWFRPVHGRNQIADSGRNTWIPNSEEPDAYLELAAPAEDLSTVIEELMVAPPLMQPI